MEPVIIGAGDAREEAVAIRALIYDVATKEKHWPPSEVHAVLKKHPASLVGAFSDGRCVGGAHVLYRRPYPIEVVFPGCIPNDDQITCETTIIAVDQDYRRTAYDGGAETLDCLVRGIYREFATMHGGTHLYALFEEWTIRVFRNLIKMHVAKITAGIHYWCGTTPCPGPDCQLTFGCVTDVRESEHLWQAQRPDFWATIIAPQSTVTGRG